MQHRRTPSSGGPAQSKVSRAVCDCHLAPCAIHLADCQSQAHHASLPRVEPKPVVCIVCPQTTCPVRPVSAYTSVSKSHLLAQSRPWTASARRACPPCYVNQRECRVPTNTAASSAGKTILSLPKMRTSPTPSPKMPTAITTRLLTLPRLPPQPPQRCTASHTADRKWCLLKVWRLHNIHYAMFTLR